MTKHKTIVKLHSKCLLLKFVITILGLTYLKSKYVSDWRPPTAFGTVLMIFCDNSNFSKKIYDVSSSGNSLNRFFDKSETKKQCFSRCF